MSVRMHITRAKTGSRRAHDGIGGPRLAKDTASGAVHLRHRMDPVTGTYRGRSVFAVPSAVKGKTSAAKRKTKKSAKAST